MPRPPSPEGNRDDVAVKIDGSIAEMARTVCNRRRAKTGAGRLSLRDYFSDLLRDPVQRDYLRELEAMQEEAKQLRKPRKPE